MSKPSDYEVGYGKSPKANRFKPGQSGNPKGRPKGAKSFGKILAEQLNKRMRTRTSEGSTKVSTREALAMSLMQKALKGDFAAIRTILEMTEVEAEKEVSADLLSDSEYADLERFKETLLKESVGLVDGTNEVSVNNDGCSKAPESDPQASEDDQASNAQISLATHAAATTPQPCPEETKEDRIDRIINAQ